MMCILNDDAKEKAVKPTIKQIVNNNSFYLEDVVFALVDSWKEYVKETGEYVSFKKYLKVQEEYGDGLNQLFSEYVLLKEF